MPDGDRIGPAFVLITAVWSVALALAGHHDALLFLAPALLLAVPLLFGRYVAEEQIHRLRERLFTGAPDRRTARAASCPSRRVVVALPRGGALIAAALATRPPPQLVQFA